MTRHKDKLEAVRAVTQAIQSKSDSDYTRAVSLLRDKIQECKAREHFEASAPYLELWGDLERGRGQSYWAEQYYRFALCLAEGRPLDESMRMFVPPGFGVHTAVHAPNASAPRLESASASTPQIHAQDPSAPQFSADTSTTPFMAGEFLLGSALASKADERSLLQRVVAPEATLLRAKICALFTERQPDQRQHWGQIQDFYGELIRYARQQRAPEAAAFYQVEQIASRREASSQLPHHRIGELQEIFLTLQECPAQDALSTSTIRKAAAEAAEILGDMAYQSCFYRTAASWYARSWDLLGSVGARRTDMVAIRRKITECQGRLHEAQTIPAEGA